MFGKVLLSPATGRLTVYLLGPSFGESQVLLMPDRRVVVVDACVDGGTNLPAVLLDKLGLKQIDLLVITHPDLDHIRGLEELVRRFKPLRVWRYPTGILRDLFVRVATAVPGDARLQDLRAVLDALEDHLEATGNVSPAFYGSRWSPPGSGYTVHGLAPTHYDQERVRKVVDGLIRRDRGRWIVSPAFVSRLNGTCSLGDAPNIISIGLVVEWGARKLLLGGDVLQGTASRFSGWKGVMAALDTPDEARGHLVDDVSLVKVAHHGSRGAFEQTAWTRHTSGGKTIGLVAPFSRKKLPDEDTLINLRRHCSQLAITSEGGASFSRASAVGWRKRGAAPSGSSPCVMAVVPDVGPIELHTGSRAECFF
ncbi:MAG TPA: MBL fold metallo-hydrolase [Kofleriaceae bacterium]|jgi:beta-lactamase superfamily II metal-dependent hydrolase